MTNEYLKTMNILYVEDEPSIREGYEKTLNRCARKLYIAVDGEMGLEFFKDNDDIDIIVSDIKMPKMNGIDMVKQIQQINPNIPVIFTTAHGESGFLLEAIELQVEGYILKPVPIKKLINKIEKISKNIMLERINKRQEKQLIQIEKMAAMGELIENISHQWRQPLSAISTAATGLALQKEYDNLTDKFFFETCQMIDTNAQFLSKTIENFKEKIKPQDKMKVFNLKQNIESFLELVDITIRNNNIKIILDLQKDIELNSYENKLVQFFINMFNNSKDIFEKTKQNDKLIFITTYTKDNNIFIIFKDNGGGIPDNILTKIFEPYFTTKHQSTNTGLGLHMIYNFIVNHMKGDIQVENSNFIYNTQSFTGANFCICLPAL